MIDKTLDRINKYIPQKWQWVLAHGGFRKYFKNTGWMLGGQILYLLISFLIGAWIARYLGPQQYGVVSYAVAFVGLFSFISALGVDEILKREMVKRPEDRDRLMGTGFILKLIGSTIAFLLVLFLSLFVISDTYITKMLIILYSFSFFFTAPLVLNIYFYSQVKAKRAIQAHLLATIISSLLKVVLIFSGAGIIWLIAIYVFDSFLHVFFLSMYYRLEKLKIFHWKYDGKVAKELLKDSWPLMLSTAAATIYLKIDQVMVGRIMGDSSVGIYAAGVKLTEVFYFLPGIICGSLFPAIVNGMKTGFKVYFGRLKNLYLLLGVVAILVSIVVSLLAEPITRIVFGLQYLESIPVLRLYVWSSIGLFLGHAVTNQLMVENKTMTIFLINAVAMVVNVSLNLYLIPKMGLTGAALSTLISYSIIPIWHFLYGWRRSKDSLKI